MADAPDDALWHRYHNDPEFLARVRVVQLRSREQGDQVALTTAAMIVRDLFPDADWLAEQAEHARELERIMNGWPALNVVAHLPDATHLGYSLHGPGERCDQCTPTTEGA